MVEMDSFFLISFPLFSAALMLFSVNKWEKQVLLIRLKPSLSFFDEKIDTSSYLTVKYKATARKQSA